MGRPTVRGFDWNEFWERTGEGAQMRKGALRMANRLSKLIDVTGARTVADFGCGSGRTSMTLARKYPNIEFIGFDGSQSAVRACSSEVRRSRLRNLSFAVDTLPYPRCKGRFDIVYSVATLHYVEDNRSAIGALYSMVSPGGALVINYPNRHTMYWYRRWVMGEGRGQGERFRLVLGGINLLTRREIEGLLGSRSSSFWAFVGEPPSMGNPCILVRKPPLGLRESPGPSIRKP
jgi:trans-aconitate methyltransferase